MRTDGSCHRSHALEPILRHAECKWQWHHTGPGGGALPRTRTMFQPGSTMRLNLDLARTRSELPDVQLQSTKGSLLPDALARRSVRIQLLGPRHVQLLLRSRA